MRETNWIPGLVVLGTGLAAGLFAALRLRGGGAAATTASGRPRTTTSGPDLLLRDLQAKRDSLFAQLRELEDTGGKLPPEELARQRYQLELSAAEALQALDRHEATMKSAANGTPSDAAPSAAVETTAAGGAAPAAPAPAVAPAPAPGGMGALGGALVGVVATSFVFALIWYAQQDAKVREEGMGITGGPPAMGGGSARPAAGPNAGGAAAGHPQVADEGGLDPREAAALDAEIADLQRLAAAHPDSLEAKNDLARALVQRQKLMEAFQVAKEVLAVDAENPPALVVTAVVRLAMGQVGMASELIETALRRDPTLVEGWVYRGLVAFEGERWDVAVTSWEKAIALRPDGAAAITPALEAARARQKGGPPPAAPTAAMAGGPASGGGAPRGPMQGGPMQDGPMQGGPMQGGPMQGGPAAGGAAPAGAAAATGPGISGTIELGPGVSVPPGSLIFVTVRAEGVTAGPPIAAKRLQAIGLPLTFSVGPADAMLGQPFPPRATLEARLDADGNAMTREPGAPAARIDGLTPGATGARLVLAPR